MIIKIICTRKLCTLPRFKTEPCGISEIAYSYVLLSINYKTINCTLVTCLFSYGPTSVLSQGKRTHNSGIDEKGLGRACHTVSSQSFPILIVPNLRPVQTSREKQAASSPNKLRSSL